MAERDIVRGQTRVGKMDGAGREASVHLPEEIVEKILAMVPFPSLFKARTLSKSLQANFLPISSQEDKIKKSRAVFFQRQVSELSHTNWKTFCPMFWGPKDFLAYNQASNRWQRMPWSCILPKDVVEDVEWWHLEGSLLVVCGIDDNLHVANILTGSWKLLPRRPMWGDELYILESISTCVIPMSSDTYQIILFHENGAVGSSFADIYDSQTGAWRTETLFISAHYREHWKMSTLAHLDGVLYRVVRNEEDEYYSGENDLDDSEVHGRLLAFHIRENKFESLEIPLLTNISTQSTLVACGGSLLLLTYDRPYKVGATKVIVQKIDTRSQKISDVTRGPPASLSFGCFVKYPTTDGICIFFAGTGSGFNEILAYNVLDDNWSCFPMLECFRDSDLVDGSIGEYYYPSVLNAMLPLTVGTSYKWMPCAFQPGLNPFASP